MAAPIVKEIFESSRRGNGLKEICKELNGRGITNKGRRWQKNVVHYLLTNEAYTGTAVWGVKSKDEKAGDPVRVENAWPALVSRELFEAVQQGLHERAPTLQRPARVGSQYLLSGLLRCGVCGKPYSGQGAKSGQFAYYVCASLFREGAGACTARYLNATKVENLVIEKVRERILTEETITELVTLVAEEIDNLAGEVNGRLTAIRAELSDVDARLENLYQALETKQLPIEVLSPRILSLKAHQDQLTAAREEAESQLEQRRAELPTSKEIKGYVADFREFLQEGTFPERKALIRNFVQGIEIVEDEAVLTYTIPMPSDWVTSESASVLDFVQSGPPSWIRTASNREPCHTRYNFSGRLPKVNGEAFSHSAIPFAEMTLGFRRPGVCSAGSHAVERPAPPECLQSRFPGCTPLAAMRPTLQVGVVFSFDAELEVRIGDWPSTPATGSFASNCISLATSH